VQEKAITDESMPYKFTGKELDKETGLYYFGARYYDARISRWVSTDPILDKYLPKGLDDFDGKHDYYYQNKNDKISKLNGIGGVFNPPNIDLYHYSFDNPIKYIDPDGHEGFVSDFGSKIVIDMMNAFMGGSSEPVNQDIRILSTEMKNTVKTPFVNSYNRVVYGPWTFQIGGHLTGGKHGFGGTGGLGFAFSNSSRHGFQGGLYGTYGYGFLSTPGLSGTITATVSGNSSITNLRGLSVNFGGSYGAAKVGGIEYSTPIGSKGLNSYSVSFGLGLWIPTPIPGEGHVFRTNTGILPLFNTNSLKR